MINEITEKLNEKSIAQYKIIEEKYNILTKYLNLLIGEKDFISKDDIKLILEALNKNILIGEEAEENE